MNRQTEDQGTAENCAKSKPVRVDCGVRGELAHGSACFMAGDTVRDDYGNGRTGYVSFCPNPDMHLAKTEPVILTVRFGLTEIAIKDFADGALVKQTG